MRLVSLAAVAALALGTASPAAPPLAPGEVLLEISAIGENVSHADRATLRVAVSADGSDQADAQHKVDAEVARLRAVARAAGIPAEDIRPAPSSDAARGMIAANAAVRDLEEATADVQRGDERAAPVRLVVRASPSASAVAGLEIVTRDIARVESLSRALRGDSDSVVVETRYALRDPQPAQADARARALAKARSDAEAYAALLHLRVARIVRVSARMGADGFAAMMADDPEILHRIMGTGQNQGAEITTMASLGVDFVLAPQ